jgi:endonuclease YncB( thermonuclease family)
MRRNSIWAFIILLIILSSCTSLPSPPPSSQTPSTPLKPTASVFPTATLKPGQERAVVVEVIDGLTIMVEVNGETKKVWYKAISLSSTEPKEIHDEAEVVNRGLVEGKIVILEKREGVSHEHGRLERFVFSEDGTFVNAELLRRGLARFASAYGGQYLDEMRTASEEARAGGRGMWGYPTSTPRPTQLKGREIVRATEVTYYRNLECTMASPPPVMDPSWNGTVLNTLCLDVKQSYPELDSSGYQPIFEVTKQILTNAGMTVMPAGETCDATLAISITGTATASPYYEEGGGTVSCYNGSHGEGTISLTAPGQEKLTVPIFGGYNSPFMISHCNENPPKAPNDAYERYWEMAVLKGLAELWGQVVPIQALLGIYDGSNLSSAVYNGAAQALLNLSSPYEECAVPALIHALLVTNDKNARESIGIALGYVSGNRNMTDPKTWLTWWTSVE